MTDYRLKLTQPSLLLVVAAVIAGCNQGHATQDRMGSANAETGIPATQEAVRAARSYEVGQSSAISEEIYTQMMIEEQALLEHGLPGYRPVYVENQRLGVRVDPQTGKLAWRAETCANPNCEGEGHQGGPLLFVNKVAGLHVGADGKLVGKARFPLLKCPACGRFDTVEIYLPPDAVRRRAELEAELVDVRRQRRTARQNGETPPTHLRAPDEIMREMSSLPILYLVEE